MLFLSEYKFLIGGIVVLFVVVGFVFVWFLGCRSNLFFKFGKIYIEFSLVNRYVMEYGI